MSSRMFRNIGAVSLIMATSSSPCWAAAAYLVGGTLRPLGKEFGKMKRALLSSALACAVAFGGATALAQMGQGGPGQGGGWHGQHGSVSTDQRLQMMTKQLNLTGDQQQQIKPILESETQQMQALRQDTSLSQEDRMTKMKQIHETTASQIKPILTADQQAKWEQMMSRRGPRGGMGTGGPPPQREQQQQPPQ